MKKREMLLISVINVVIVFIIIFFSFNNSDNKQYYTKAKKVNFNVFVETEYETGIYTPSNDMPLMDGYYLDYNLSYCYDRDGKKIDPSFYEDEGYITGNFNTTSQCYLYFSKDMQGTSELLTKHILDSDITTKVLEDNDDTSRFTNYYGNYDYNYICFGTNSRKACINDKNKYLYRVLGVVTDNDGKEYTKLVKYSSLSSNYQYNSTVDDEQDLSDVDLFKGLNGSYFYKNSDYSYFQETKWNSKIKDWTFISASTLTVLDPAKLSGRMVISGIDYRDNDRLTVYLHEFNKPNKTIGMGGYYQATAKIGLMNLSDYILSGNNDHEYYCTCDVVSWVHLTRNAYGNYDTGYKTEYTLSRYGDLGKIYSIEEDGSVGETLETEKHSVRPVFYLKSDVNYISGAGSIDDPLMIDTFELPTVTGTYKNKYITLKINGSGYIPKMYCINKSVDDVSSCEWNDLGIDYTKIKTTVNDKIYVHLKDAYERIIHSNLINCIYYINSKSFYYTGTEAEYEILLSGNYTIDLEGAQGSNNGGNGGYLSVVKYFSEGEILKIKVGGMNGYNGGGTGTYNGGGATTVSLNGKIILVAAGGGGGDSGGAGGSGTGLGGEDVGNGSGSAGTNGGGGGSSPNYTGSSCYPYTTTCTTENCSWENKGDDGNPGYVCDSITSPCTKYNCSSYTTIGKPGYGGKNIIDTTYVSKFVSDGSKRENGAVLINYNR